MAISSASCDDWAQIFEIAPVLQRIRGVDGVRDGLGSTRIEALAGGRPGSPPVRLALSTLLAADAIEMESALEVRHPVGAE
jgi:hypothetical protein